MTRRFRLFAEPWPRDARLDPYRDGVFELRTGGRVSGYLTTTVGPMRSFPALWIKQEWLWAQPHWLDGHRQEPEEDYGPGWYLIEQLQAGAFEAFDAQAGDVVTFEAVQIQGSERARLWRQYGSPDAAD